MADALGAAGIDRPVDPGCRQPHERPPGSGPPPLLAGVGLDPEEIVPGLVALRMDPLLLLQDDQVGAPLERDRLGIGPFVCLEVAEGADDTTWAALTDREGANRLAIEPIWRDGGDSKWRWRRLFLLDSDELWVGPRAAFVTAAWREALSDLKPARLTEDGLRAIQKRIIGAGRADDHPVDWEAVARASTHLLQVSILEILAMDGGRRLSPTELSQELQIPVSKTSYHVSRLKRLGLIVLADTKPARATIEHFYGLRGAPREFPPFDFEGLARASSHPLRVSILEIFGIDGGRTLSPNELTKELQIALSNTSHHVGGLAKAGLLVPAGKRKVRGATEHFYRLPRPAPEASRIVPS